MDTALTEISTKSRESKRNHEELMEGLGETFSNMGELLLEIKQKDNIPDKPNPDPYILPNHPISIMSPVYKPSETKMDKKFPHHFPPEKDTPKSSKENLSLVSIQQLAYENLPNHVYRPPTLDLLGKGRLPETQTFAEDWFP